MRYLRHLGAAASFICCLATSALADFNLANFPNTNGLTLAGNAAVTNSLLRLTPSTGNQAGSAYYTAQQSVAGGFSTTFTFRISQQSGGGADGFAFLIQTASANSLGGNGCRIGYHEVTNSLAVEFDTHQTGSCVAGDVNDINDNHISIHTLGAAPNSVSEAASIGSAAGIPNMSDGAVHTVKIEYTPPVGGGPGAMMVYLDDLTTPRITAPVDLSTIGLNSGRAWVGFTAATGGAAERHDILSWSFTEGAPIGSNRPRTPTITEPNVDFRVVNGQDVHMETNPFFSPIGANHLCTDWEIWKTTGNELVWRAACVTGVERLHIHLGDGVFMGSYTGRTDLEASSNFSLRARHRDDSGDPATEYSLWQQRPFITGAPGANLAMIVQDVLVAPIWTDAAGGASIVLPAAGPDPASVTLESGTGGMLVTIAGDNGTVNTIINPPPLSDHVEVRAHIYGGDSGLTLPATNLSIINEHCQSKTVYLPPLSLAAGAHAYYWVSAAGSTYLGNASQAHSNFTTLARGSDLPFLATQHGYVVEKFATGLQLPVNIAFVPNPGPAPDDVLCYVTELYGTIKMVTRSGTVSDYRTGLINFSPTGAFPGSGEQGLTGICVDPDNGDVFVTVLQADAQGNHHPRVLRLQSTDGGRTASTVTTLLHMQEVQGQSHQVSHINIGPDGMLYVHNGDGFVASTGQDLTRFRGKILRMTKAGAAPADNPFYNATDGISSRDYAYAYGVRNPFGGARRTSDGLYVIIENGPSVDRFMKLVAGRNYLWDGSDASMANFAIYNWNPSRGPVNGAFIEPGVFGGSGFPPEKMGQLFITESGPTYANGTQTLGKRIREFKVDGSGDGSVVGAPGTLVEYAGAGRATVVGLAAGPDGLYFTDLYKDLNAATPIERGASLYRVRYVRTPETCCSADFDGDGDTGTDADIEAFFRCLAGDCCATCQSADFNLDGDTGTDADIEAFFRVLAGGPC
jgi:glucose/arabinose dehydrogenase